MPEGQGVHFARSAEQFFCLGTEKGVGIVPPAPFSPALTQQLVGVVALWRLAQGGTIAISLFLILFSLTLLSGVNFFLTPRFFKVYFYAPRRLCDALAHSYFIFIYPIKNIAGKDSENESDNEI